MSEINFSDIHPFVRFSDIQTVENGFDLSDVHGFDARIAYVFSGSVRFKMNGVSYTGKRGSLVLFLPKVKYSLLNDSGEDASTMVIDFSFQAKPDSPRTPRATPWIPDRVWKESEAFDLVTIADVPAFNEPIFLESMQALEPLFKEMCTEQRNIRICRTEIRGALMHAVLLHIYRRLMLVEEKKSRSLVDEVLDYIHQNYSQPISNDTIGKHFNYHPNYISRILRKRTGQSLHRYLLTVRAERALELLQTTSLSATEVAERVGFSSIKHLSQTFKGIYGFSPMHFRD